MGFIKCPRCELNYIREEEQYCPVCKREMKGESHNDPFELCSICNENPVMPGKDVCYACYKEMTQQQVADAAHIQTRQYQRLENGERNISGASMRIGLSVCAVLKLDPYRFMPEFRWSKD